ncbi:nuclear factor 7, ovary-like [Perca fluviatilis]|uniref:nuclear factor 7, ovary-like n=1 Tax=Perca fluviatilis TaxID=8168 RepID=UPI001962AF2E|nr:nuclear factor 7, ovary-like [Perca fluviatilis]
MAAANYLQSEDQFLCSICLDVFTDPVTTSCGHNFCKNCITDHWNTNDQYLCPLYHKMHDVVPLKEGYEGKKAELGKTEAEIQQMIQKRQLKIEKVKYLVDLSEECADLELADGVQFFTSLKESAERGQANLIKTIEEKQKITKRKAEAFVKELEQDISELKKRRTEVEQLSRSEDPLHLLQSVQSLNTNHPPPTKDLTEVGFSSPSYEGIAVRAMANLEETLGEKTIGLLQTEQWRVQLCAVDVTLDPDTAHPDLFLSDDGKQVSNSDLKKNVPDNPKRFDDCNCVLGKQSFSSGSFYFEVQVKGKIDWILGVVRESINRKGEIALSPEGGYWTIWLRNVNQYYALDDPDVRLCRKSRPQTSW